MPTDAMLWTALLRCAARSGQEFYTQCVVELSTHIECEHALLARCHRTASRTMETLALARRGKVIANTRYDLDHSPCRTVIEQQSPLLLHDARRHFPHCRLFQDLGVQSYYAIPLMRKGGAPDGILALLHSQPLVLSSTAKNLMEMMALRAQTEIEREEINEHLRHAHKMHALGMLAGGIAHDFNNILAAIVGIAELTLLDHPAPGSQTAQNMNMIMECCQRANAIVQTMLAFNHRNHVTLRPTDPAQCVRDILPMLSAGLGSRIKLQIDLSSQTPGVLADPLLLQQALVSLSTNAAHAMRPNGGTLTLRVEPVFLELPLAVQGKTLPPGHYARLQMIDSGPGIDPSLMDHVFEPFFTSKNAAESSGIGLFGVLNILDEFGGGIQLQSTPGSGTTATLYLPRNPETPDESTPAGIPDTGAAPDTAPDTAPAPPPHPARILFVDDEDDLRRILTDLLTVHGYHITPAPNGYEALKVLDGETEPFDLLLTDAVMPGLSGLELADRVRTTHPGLKIALITAYSKDIAPSKIKEVGIADILHKPITSGDLLAALRRILSQPSPDGAPDQRAATRS